MKQRIFGDSGVKVSKISWVSPTLVTVAPVMLEIDSPLQGILFYLELASVSTMTQLA